MSTLRASNDIRSLLDRWAERDRRYSRRPYPVLRDEEVAAIRACREREIAWLPAADQPRARTELNVWLAAHSR